MGKVYLIINKIANPIVETITEINEPSTITETVDEESIWSQIKKGFKLKPASERVLGKGKGKAKAIEQTIIKEDQPIAWPSIIEQLIDDAPNLDDDKLLEAVSEINDTVKEIPKIEIKTSSDESIEHFLPQAEVTQEEVKSGFTNIMDNIRSKIDSPITGKIIMNPNETDKTELIRETDNMRIDTLIEIANNVPGINESFVDSLLYEKIDSQLTEMVKDNPGMSKQNMIEKFIQQNPTHKDKILIHVNKTVNDQLDYLQARLSDKDLAKFNKHLATEDLKEIQSLSEDRTVDQIKALRAINRSHNNLLKDIKRKASKSSISQSSKDGFEDNNSQQFDDTMNLFD
jgi:hypothetical protein